jgi:hypothetical protein
MGMKMIELHTHPSDTRIMVNVNQIHSISETTPVQVGVGATAIFVRESFDAVMDLIARANGYLEGSWRDGMD